MYQPTARPFASAFSAAFAAALMLIATTVPEATVTSEGQAFAAAVTAAVDARA